MSPRFRSRLVAEGAVGAVVLGVAAGIAWTLLAPDIQGEVTAEGVAVRGAEARRTFGVLGWYVVTIAVAGVVHGVVTSVRHRARPVATLFTVVMAGAFGAAIAWGTGVLVGPGAVPEGLDPGTTVTVPLQLTWPAAVLVWPIAAVIGAAVAAAARDDRLPWTERVSRSDRSGPSSPT